jgi:hypothetical protein
MDILSFIAKLFLCFLPGVLIILAAHGLKQFLEHRRKKEEENFKNDFLVLLRSLMIAEVMRIGLSEDQQNGEEE